VCCTQALIADADFSQKRRGQEEARCSRHRFHSSSANGGVIVSITGLYGNWGMVFPEWPGFDDLASKSTRKNNYEDDVYRAMKKSVAKRAYPRAGFAVQIFRQDPGAKGGCACLPGCFQSLERRQRRAMASGSHRCGSRGGCSLPRHPMAMNIHRRTQLISPVQRSPETRPWVPMAVGPIYQQPHDQDRASAELKRAAFGCRLTRHVVGVDPAHLMKRQNGGRHRNENEEGVESGTVRLWRHLS
jgi:hypothetical protein